MFDEVVLKSSSQCVALIRYDTSVVTNHARKDSCAIGASMHERLREIVDHFFNDGPTTATESHYKNPWLETSFRTPRSQTYLRPSGWMTHSPVRTQTRKPHTQVSMAAPAASNYVPSAMGRSGGSRLTISRQQGSSDVKRSPTTLPYVAPKSLHPSDISSLITSMPARNTQQTDCAVCLCPLNDGGPLELATLKVCGHALHKSCLSNALKQSPKCPVCRKATSEPCGKMPSGTMTVT